MCMYVCMHVCVCVYDIGTMSQKLLKRRLEQDSHPKPKKVKHSDQEAAVRCTGCGEVMMEPGQHCASWLYWWSLSHFPKLFEEPIAPKTFHEAPCDKFWCQKCCQDNKHPSTCPASHSWGDPDDSDVPTTFPIITGIEDPILREADNAVFLQAREAAIQLRNTGSIMGADPWGNDDFG